MLVDLQNKVVADKQTCSWHADAKLHIVSRMSKVDYPNKVLPKRLKNRTDLKLLTGSVLKH